LRKSLIIGVDSGVTTAISLISICLDFVNVKSKRNFSKKEIIETIMEEGNPLIVGCDVKKAPELVTKIASVFNAKLILPKKNLSLEKKKRLISKFNKKCAIKLKNKHEHDALAIAIFALNKFKPLFGKIDNIGNNINKEKVKIIMIKGGVSNIKQAINKVNSYF